MKFDILSDIHLETGSFDVTLLGDGDILLLAGDILNPYSNPRNNVTKTNNIARMVDIFLLQVSQEYQHVYMVMGNHEHYHGDITQTKGIIKDIFKRLDIKNITLLDDDIIKFDKFIMFGGTLWTNVNNSNPLDMMDIQNGISDFHLIKNNGKNFNVQDTVDMNKLCRQYLANFIEEIYLDENKDLIPIIMTHHAPFLESLESLGESFKMSKINHAFINTGIEHIVNPFELRPLYWIHGHTHVNVDYQYENIRVINNHRGYANIKSEVKKVSLLL